MSEPRIAGKWISGLHADTPCLVAARRVIKLRLAAVEIMLPFATERADESTDYVHKLRVSTRRSSAALHAFDACLGRGPLKRARRCLKVLRRAAGLARQCDVHKAILTADREQLPDTARAAIDSTLQDIIRQRLAAQEQVRAAAAEHPPREIARLTRKLLESLPVDSADTKIRGRRRPYTLRELARDRWPRLIRRLRKAGNTDLEVLDNVHDLRLIGKQVRYSSELFSACFPPTFKPQLYTRIEDLQERLGTINDAHEIVLRLETQAGNDLMVEEDTDLAPLIDSYQDKLDQHHRNFIDWWSAEGQTLVGSLDALTEHLQREVAPPARVRPTEATGDAQQGQHRRVAAIDVGTNSIRLVVAETDPAVRFRIIDDRKETTRLGRGLYATGYMDPERIKASVKALRTMKAVTELYQVERLRAVGTSAMREARNASQMIKLARRQAGVRIETIEADQEARLAFSSVASAFDLSEGRSVIVDVGGGSTEVVFSTGGVLDAVHQLPLGAVRLSELFADPRAAGRYRYRRMRKAIDRIISSSIPNRGEAPLGLIGTGGTFTNLARIAICRGTTGNGVGRFPFALRGYELRRKQLGDLLESLRRMTLEERMAVPGLSSRRADIIVAGFCIVARLMKHLRVDRLRVHDGGIRDGLLIEMIDELGFESEPPQRRAAAQLADARRFAHRCDYEREHSEHVCRLGTQILDQLASHAGETAYAWAGPQQRALLQAAAILHDVGGQIDWELHHKHSRNMILHADLPSFTRREVEIVANVARYHRGGGPQRRHVHFRRLNDDDQRLVTHLSAILRIADGLDRLHVQNVLGVEVQTHPQSARFGVIAADEPVVNMKFARRKSDVFEAVFHTPADFEWIPAESQTPTTQDVP